MLDEVLVGRAGSNREEVEVVQWKRRQSGRRVRGNYTRMPRVQTRMPGRSGILLATLFVMAIVKVVQCEVLLIHETGLGSESRSSWGFSLLPSTFPLTWDQARAACEASPGAMLARVEGWHAEASLEEYLRTIHYTGAVWLANRQTLPQVLEEERRDMNQVGGGKTTEDGTGNVMGVVIPTDLSMGGDVGVTLRCAVYRVGVGVVHELCSSTAPAALCLQRLVSDRPLSSECPASPRRQWIMVRRDTKSEAPETPEPSLQVVALQPCHHKHVATALCSPQEGWQHAVCPQQDSAPAKHRKFPKKTHRGHQFPHRRTHALRKQRSHPQKATEHNMESRYSRTKRVKRQAETSGISAPGVQDELPIADEEMRTAGLNIDEIENIMHTISNFKKSSVDDEKRKTNSGGKPNRTKDPQDEGGLGEAPGGTKEKENQIDKKENKKKKRKQGGVTFKPDLSESVLPNPTSVEVEQTPEAQQQTPSTESENGQVVEVVEEKPHTGPEDSIQEEDQEGDNIKKDTVGEEDKTILTVESGPIFVSDAGPGEITEAKPMENNAPVPKEETVTKEEETVPKEEETVPKEPVINEEIVTKNEETEPKQEETLPREEETVHEEETVPKEGESLPKEEETLPKNEETLSNEETMPKEELVPKETVPKEEETLEDKITQPETDEEKAEEQELLSEAAGQSGQNYQNPIMFPGKDREPRFEGGETERVDGESEDRERENGGSVDGESEDQGTVDGEGGNGESERVDSGVENEDKDNGEKEGGESENIGSEDREITAIPKTEDLKPTSRSPIVFPSPFEHTHDDANLDHVTNITPCPEDDKETPGPNTETVENKDDGDSEVPENKDDDIIIQGAVSSKEISDIDEVFRNTDEGVAAEGPLETESTVNPALLDTGNTDIANTEEDNEGRENREPKSEDFGQTSEGDEVENERSEVGEGQTEVEEGQTEMEKPEVEHGHTEVEEGQTEVEKGQSGLEEGETEMEEGQVEAEKPEGEEGKTEVEEEEKVNAGPTLESGSENREPKSQDFENEELVENNPLNENKGVEEGDGKGMGESEDKGMGKSDNEGMIDDKEEGTEGVENKEMTEENENDNKDMEMTGTGDKEMGENESGDEEMTENKEMTENDKDITETDKEMTENKEMGENEGGNGEMTDNDKEMTDNDKDMTGNDKKMTETEGRDEEMTQTGQEMTGTEGGDVTEGGKQDKMEDEEKKEDTDENKEENGGENMAEIGEEMTAETEIPKEEEMKEKLAQPEESKPESTDEGEEGKREGHKGLLSQIFHNIFG